jgi:anti-sigma factor (TIGR02949 family)
MKCRDARARLQPFLDRTLAPHEEAHLRDHLAACEPCRRELDSLRVIDKALSTQPAVEPPPELAGAIMGRAMAEGDRRRRLLIPAWLEGWTLAAVGLGLAACALAASEVLAMASVPERLAASGPRLLLVALAAGYGIFGFCYYRE